MLRHDSARLESSEPSLINVALVGIDNLFALAKLLAVEQGVALFAGLALVEQMAIFNLFEITLTAVRDTLNELGEQKN
ncbi:phosphate starvation-inducible protein PhoH [Burkholderia sp. ABCPW 14]|uniref:phosphate starvation-inducible protein PhoH n=1 Tax=Burkholderia TaxID=32008 RepID=UPI000770C107|nr:MULTISPECIES: phosphate starvation-inducible protein PhoH [Burkholderia]KVD84443.1 phosphate starvation-inducible protein PhoH [Burkholderia sp. ABCPW 14]RIV37711.1 phosphate starvation-inducible protein PhoH [Burkholderia pseudomallei]RIV44871.1 phosphate starvation-inducible protein PhoH [Burkholderia pseudomallei]